MLSPANERVVCLDRTSMIVTKRHVDEVCSEGRHLRREARVALTANLAGISDSAVARIVG